MEHLSTVSGHLHVHNSHMACQCLCVCVWLTQYPTFLLACHQRRPSHAFALIALRFSFQLSAVLSRVLSPRQLSLSSKVSSGSLRHEFNFVSRNCLVLFTHCINFRARFRPPATLKNRPTQLEQTHTPAHTRTPALTHTQQMKHNNNKLS